MRDLGIADRLRRAGLNVVEIDGWQSRGSSSFNPRGGVDHHTAGGNKGNAPSLNICINGRPDLRGPLCNTLQGFDGTQYVIASGTANHAGSGGWRGLKGNGSVYGMERENDGKSPPRPGQHESAARAWKAIISGSPNGNISAGMVCGHKEWTPRKPDFHGVDYNWFRGLIAAGAGSGPSPIPQPPVPKPPLVQGAITMFIAIDGVALCALMGNVLFTFPDLRAYGNSKNASPNVPALVVGNETPVADRQHLYQELIAQHIVAVGKGDSLPK